MIWVFFLNGLVMQYLQSPGLDIAYNISAPLEIGHSVYAVALVQLSEVEMKKHVRKQEMYFSFPKGHLSVLGILG